MATCRYEVMQADGKKRKGTLEANNRDAAADELKKNGDFILTLVDAGALGKEIEISIGNKVKPKELALFCKQFESILAAGVTIIEALQMLAEQTENKHFKNPLFFFRYILVAVYYLNHALFKFLSSTVPISHANF